MPPRKPKTVPAWLHVYGRAGMFLASWKEAVRIIRASERNVLVTPATTRVRLPSPWPGKRRYLNPGKTAWVPRRSVAPRRYVRKGEVRR